MDAHATLSEGLPGETNGPRGALLASLPISPISDWGSAEYMMRRDRLLRRALRTRFLVTLSTTEAFEGVVVEVDGNYLVLADAHSVSPQGSRLPVDGQLWLPRQMVAYLQVAPAVVSVEAAAPQRALSGWNAQ